jgi:hypothetical protein
MRPMTVDALQERFNIIQKSHKSPWGKEYRMVVLGCYEVALKISTYAPFTLFAVI